MVDVLSSSQNLVAAARQLVLLANERDGTDNITLQLIRARRIERVGMYRGGLAGFTSTFPRSECPSSKQ